MSELFSLVNSGEMELSYLRSQIELESVLGKCHNLCRTMPTLDVSKCSSTGDGPASSACEQVPWFVPMILLNQVALGHVFLVLSGFLSVKT